MYVERDDAAPRHLLTIGRLAAYAGVTIKAVRHYHRRGLLEEPARDSSGYRRYSARHATELAKIKTLADAGVPLARIRELLAADPDRFAAAVAEIDARLAERVDELQRARRRLGELSAGDRLFVSADVARYLERLRELGVSRRTVELERDAWILLQSTSPADAATWLADKVPLMDDPEFRALYLAHDEAFDWAEDDPRLEALAERSRRWFAARGRLDDGATRPPPDPAVARFIAAWVSSSPAWARLGQLARRRRQDRV